MITTVEFQFHKNKIIRKTWNLIIYKQRSMLPGVADKVRFVDWRGLPDASHINRAHFLVSCHKINTAGNTDMPTNHR